MRKQIDIFHIMVRSITLQEPTKHKIKMKTGKQQHALNDSIQLV